MKHCVPAQEDPLSRRKYYRRAPEDELGKFGEDSEDEGDHSSSYDGPASSDDADFCEYLGWVREMEEKQIEETEMEAAYAIWRIRGCSLWEIPTTLRPPFRISDGCVPYMPGISPPLFT